MELLSVHCSDEDEAVAALEGLYPGVRLGSDPEVAFGFSLETRSTAGMTSIDVVMEGSISAEVDVDGYFQAGDFLMEGGGATSGGVAYDLSQPILFHGRMEGRWLRCENQNLQLDGRMLAEFARNDLGDEQLQLSTSGTAPTSPSAALNWRALARQVRAVLDLDGVDGYPLLLRSTFELAATAFLHSFPTTWRSADAASQGQVATKAVRRALRFAEDHAGEDIGVADLAAAARMSIRALQSAFRSQLEITPRRYLEQVRLSGARTDLLAAAPGEATVSAIARNWGFGHMGRFATLYASEYGVSPSSDLRG